MTQPCIHVHTHTHTHTHTQALAVSCATLEDVAMSRWVAMVAHSVRQTVWMHWEKDSSHQLPLISHSMNPIISPVLSFFSPPLSGVFSFPAFTISICIPLQSIHLCPFFLFILLFTPPPPSHSFFLALTLSFSVGGLETNTHIFWLQTRMCAQLSTSSSNSDQVYSTPEHYNDMSHHYITLPFVWYSTRIYPSYHHYWYYM